MSPHGTMRRPWQVGALLVLALGIFVARQGYGLGVESRWGTGPGAGFFAFWIGLGLVALALIWLAQTTFKPVPAAPADLVPDRAGLARLAIVLGALCVFAGVLTTFGFKLSMFAFLLVLFFSADRANPIAKPIVALAASFGVNYVFERLLRVPLPDATLEPLRALGL